MPNTSLTDKSTAEPVVHSLYPYDGPPTRYEWRLHNQETNDVTIFPNPGDAKASIDLDHDHLTWTGSPLISYRCYLVGEPQPDLNHQPGSPVDHDPWGLQIDLNNPPDHLLIYTLTRHPLQEP